MLRKIHELNFVLKNGRQQSYQSIEEGDHAMHSSGSSQFFKTDCVNDEYLKQRCDNICVLSTIFLLSFISVLFHTEFLLS